MPVGTLRKWISKSNRKHEVGGPAAQLPDDLPAQSWGPAQRLLALNQPHAMTPTQMHARCREKELFEHQLNAWGEAFCSATASESREARTALRDLQVKHDGLQRELRRKEKALAEAAALLVLAEKSSRPCGRMRRSDQLPTASDLANADPTVLRQRRTFAKGLRPDWAGCAYCPSNWNTQDASDSLLKDLERGGF